MPEEHKPSPPHRLPWFWVLFLGLLAVNFLSVLATQTSAQPRVRVPFSPFFLDELQAGQVRSISSKADTIQGAFATKIRYPPNDAQATSTMLFSTQVPSFWNDAQLTHLLQSENVEVNAQNPNPGTSLVATILLGFGPTILIVLLFVLLARRAASAGGGLGGLGNFGRSQARRVDPTRIRVTFADVAGIDEAKEELTEIVDFLKLPQRYERLGGRMPHGVLLYGPPGTGKTLLARAVAGEAQAAFFSIAASEFIEAIVGVGAARVRDLFAKAKEAAPSIIFIDELDAIGRSRQGTAGSPAPTTSASRRSIRSSPRWTGSSQTRRLWCSGRPTARRSSIRRCSGPVALTGASACRLRTGPAGSRSCGCIHAHSRSTTTLTSTRSRHRRREWSAPTSRTCATRRRCSPRGATTRR
jgi:hypothetical protein